ncbi:TBC1 domain family member 13 [Balamuthia mandrillaris]
MTEVEMDSVTLKSDVEEPHNTAGQEGPTKQATAATVAEKEALEEWHVLELDNVAEEEEGTTTTTSGKDAVNGEVTRQEEPHEEEPVVGATSTTTTTTITTTTTSPTAATSPTSFQERILLCEEVLSDGDMDKIRTVAFNGIPEHPGLRAEFWKVLLYYLPPEPDRRAETAAKRRKLYQEWVDLLVLDPSKFRASDTNDHPLSLGDDSQWNKFFKDTELDKEIQKDVKRTFPHLHFFNSDLQKGSTKHYKAIKRILFIYAKLNPGINYVQGMNEILGPIYYVMATDPEPEHSDNAESDAFFCFTNLMSEIRDNFCKTLDRSETGINGSMNRLNNLLKRRDLEVWQRLEDQQLVPQFYSFRWLTLLLSQEFELPDVLRLWDSFFADTERFDFVTYFCCAMIVCVRDLLIEGSFADNLKLLQNYPISRVDTGVLLNKASEMRQEDKRRRIALSSANPHDEEEEEEEEEEESTAQSPTSSSSSATAASAHVFPSSSSSASHTNDLPKKILSNSLSSIPSSSSPSTSSLPNAPTKSSTFPSTTTAAPINKNNNGNGNKSNNKGNHWNFSAFRGGNLFKGLSLRTSGGRSSSAT